MDFNAIIIVLNYIEQVTQDSGLPGHYQDLINLLNQAQQSPSEDISNQIIAKKKHLEEIHQSLQPRTWDYYKTKIFNDFGAGKILGDSMISQLNTIFILNQANPTGAAQKIQEALNETNSLLQTVKNIKDGLGALVNKSDPLKLGEEETILELVFTDQVAVKTINDLEAAAKEWRIIISHFSQLVNEPSTPTKIYSIEKGSLIITAAVSKKVAEVITMVVEKVLGIWKTKLEIDKIQEEVKQSKIETEYLELKLDEEKFLSSKRQEVVTLLVDKFRSDLTGESKKDGIESNLNDGVKRIYEFVGGGGIIDTSEDQNSDPIMTNMKLSLKYDEVRKLGASLNKLPLLSSTSVQASDEQVEDEKPNTQDEESNETSE